MDRSELLKLLRDLTAAGRVHEFVEVVGDAAKESLASDVEEADLLEPDGTVRKVRRVRMLLADGGLVLHAPDELAGRCACGAFVHVAVAGRQSCGRCSAIACGSCARHVGESVVCKACLAPALLRWLVFGVRPGPAALPPPGKRAR